MLRRSLLASAFVLLTAPALAAFTWQPYSDAALAAAQKDGKTVVVAVHADWCPTCRAQAPILEEVLAEPGMAEVVAIRVNFDTDKDFLTAHDVAKQSTIIVFRGDREVARTLAETDPGRLRTFVVEAAGG